MQDVTKPCSNMPGSINGVWIRPHGNKYCLWDHLWNYLGLFDYSQTDGLIPVIDPLDQIDAE